MLNLAHVESFLAVVDCGNFHDASRKLARSQPTVSQHILKLESRLRTALVVRDRRRCYPTAAGKRFVPLARGLLNLAERAQTVLSGQSLTVGASSNVGTYLLQPLIRSFGQTCGADTHIDMVIDTNPVIAEKLHAHHLDAAVMEWWDDTPGLRADMWRREDMVVIVAPDHPWATRALVSRDILLQTPLIAGEDGSGTGRVLRQAFGEKAARLSVNLKLGSTEAVKHAVKAGLGVSIVLAGAVEEEVRTGSLRALTIDGCALAKDLFVIRHANQPAGALGSRFAAHLLEA